MEKDTLTSHIINSLLNQGNKVVIKLLHPGKPMQFRKEGNFGILFILFVLRDYGLSKDRHVFGELLLILLFGVLIRRLDNEFCRIDIGQLGTITVTTSGDFLFIVVVVGGCEEMGEDELWDPDFLFLFSFVSKLSYVEHKNCGQP
jgi:hypothetical protein